MLILLNNHNAYGNINRFNDGSNRHYEAIIRYFIKSNSMLLYVSRYTNIL
jgi:hypothetical protein